MSLGGITWRCVGLRALKGNFSGCLEINVCPLQALQDDPFEPFALPMAILILELFLISLTGYSSTAAKFHSSQDLVEATLLRYERWTHPPTHSL